MTLWHDDADWENMPDVEISIWKSSQSNNVVYSPRRFMVEKELGAQFSCFTGTKVQILTQKALWFSATPRGSWGASFRHSLEKDNPDTDESPFEIFVRDVRGVTVNVCVCVWVCVHACMHACMCAHVCVVRS
jgi:hypothetical protein